MINAVIQISHFQSNIDWPKLKASGVLGCVAKASQGSTHKDEMYNQHRLKAEAAGLLWGAEHYGDSSDPSEQVKNFLAAAKPDSDTLLILNWSSLGSSGSSGGSSSEGELVHGDPDDLHGGSGGELEEGKQEPVSSGGSDQTMSLEGARKFITLLNEAGVGSAIGILSGSVAKEQLGGKPPDPVLKECFFWIQQYADKPENIPLTWEKGFSFWQYTDGTSGPEPHEAPGVGPCYRSRFNGEKPGLLKLWSGEEEKSGKGKR